MSETRGLHCNAISSVHILLIRALNPLAVLKQSKRKRKRQRGEVTVKIVQSFHFISKNIFSTGFQRLKIPLLKLLSVNR